MLRGERHVALITADLFAALLGQRDIEHQDEHVDHRFTFDHVLSATGQVRRTAAYDSYLPMAIATQGGSADQ